MSNLAASMALGLSLQLAELVVHVLGINLHRAGGIDIRAPATIYLALRELVTGRSVVRLARLGGEPAIHLLRLHGEGLDLVRVDVVE
eukprot:364255-Heterocapsa_arctica.AAC.1